MGYTQGEGEEGKKQYNSFFGSVRFGSFLQWKEQFSQSVSMINKKTELKIVEYLHSISPIKMKRTSQQFQIYNYKQQGLNEVVYKITALG